MASALSTGEVCGLHLSCKMPLRHTSLTYVHLQNLFPTRCKLRSPLRCLVPQQLRFDVLHRHRPLVFEQSLCLSFA